MEFKIGDYVIPIENNYEESTGINCDNLSGVVVRLYNGGIDKQNSKKSIDILDLSTGKLSKKINEEYFKKSILPDELKDYYDLLMSASNFKYETKQINFYGETVSVNTLMDQLRKTQCLCLNCELMTESMETNCQIAQSIYEMCVENYMSMAITKCKAYKPKKTNKKILKYK